MAEETTQSATTVGTEPSADMECVLSELREANRRLVIAGLRMQEAAEQAELRRVEAEAAAAKIRDSQARMASILRTSLEAIITVDTEGKVVEMNPAAENMFGYTSDEIIGQSVMNLMPERLRSGDQGYITNDLYSGRLKRGAGRELAGRRKDGSNFPIALSVAAFELDNKRFYTRFVRDIGPEKENEKKVYGLLAELREADRNKNEFLATLELRGPLAPLRNVLELAKRANESGDLPKQGLRIMERQLAQMMRLVDDLLDISRITRNALELRKERVELASVINTAVEMCRPLAQCVNQEITILLAPKPIYLDADAVRLSQVFSNLLNNACKYSESGGRISLIAECTNGEVTVKITDNGIGIPLEMLPNVFELFVQVDRSSNRSQGGLGIGLTLVKRLVEMHGGTVEAFSEGLGRGSEFVVRLPILDEREQVLTPAPSTEAPATAARHILVVDDNRDSAISLAMLLKFGGNETYTAHDGLEAITAAERFRPEIVLLDIGLPKLSGLEAARRIRAQSWGKDMVLVALTGWGQDEDRRKSKEAGFDYHMVKPVDPNALMELLVQKR